MNVQVHSVIGSLVAERVAGHTLPAPLYTSQEAFEADLDIFFRRHWIVAGVEADVPEPGDVRTLDIGKTALLIVRDDDGKLRAFHNVCRHRGARLVQEETASLGRIVCPYHQWSYDLDGALVHAGKMGKTFDKSCHSLRPVQIRSIAGVLMICVADEAPADIDEVAAVLTPRLAPFGLAEARIAHEALLVEEGNWKLSIDNNRECYHCETSHPELCRSLNGLDLGFDPDDMTPDEMAEWEEHAAEALAATRRWEADGFPSSLIEEMSGRTTIFRTTRYAIEGANEAHTMDSTSASTKLMGAMTDPKMGDTHLWTHNSWHHFFADHAVVSYIIPLAPGKTLLRTVWLVHKDAKEGRDYDLQRLTEVWTATNRQDADLVKMAQRGVESSGYRPGPLSPHVEYLVAKNLDWYIDRLRAHGV